MNSLNTKKAILIAFVCSAYFFSINTFVKFYKADVSYEKSQVLFSEGKSSAAAKYAINAIKLNPNEPKYYQGRAKIYITATLGEGEVTTLGLKRLALNDLVTSFNLNPINLATIRNSIPIYYFLATQDLSKPSGPDNVDPVFGDIAKQYLASIKNYSPKDVGIYTTVANYEKKLGLEKEFIESQDKVKELRSDLLEWYDPIKD